MRKYASAALLLIVTMPVAASARAYSVDDLGMQVHPQFQEHSEIAAGTTYFDGTPYTDNSCNGATYVEINGNVSFKNSDRSYTVTLNGTDLPFQESGSNGHFVVSPVQFVEPGSYTASVTLRQPSTGEIIDQVDRSFIVAGCDDIAQAAPQAPPSDNTPQESNDSVNMAPEQNPSQNTQSTAPTVVYVQESATTTAQNEQIIALLTQMVQLLMEKLNALLAQRAAA